MARRPTEEDRALAAWTLSCPACGWRTIEGDDGAVARLRGLGALRRDSAPEPEVLAELLRSALPRMECPACGGSGLATAVAAPDEQDADEWQAAVLCEACRKPIDPERVEALPGVRRCAACQARAEAGQSDDEPEFCHRCGSLMELRVSRAGGLTRYRMFCTGDPPCRA